MKEQIIHLDPSDDFHSARDKIGWTQTDRLLLVWPQNGRAASPLDRKLDLVLLQRHADRLGAQLALVTDDDVIADHAGDVGLPIFANVHDGHLHRWKRRRRQRAALSVPASRRRARQVVATAEAPLVDWQWPAWLNNPTTRLLGSMATFGVAAIAILVMLALTVPRAEVNLTPNVQQINAPLDIIADPAQASVDVAARRIPARTATVEVEGSLQVPATGSADRPTARAQGVATFTNLTAQPVRIPAGAAVRTTGSVPIRFVTQQDVELPAEEGSTADAPILAVEPGPAGNIGPGLLNDVEGPLSVQAAVVNLQATGGGEVTQVAAVTEADREQALALLTADLLRAGSEEIAATLSANEFAPVETLRVESVLEQTFDQFAGGQADTLNLELRLLVAASVVDEQDAFAVGRGELEARVGHVLQLIPSSVLLERAPVTYADESGVVEFGVTARGAAGPVFDNVAVQQATRWQSLDNARAILMTEFPVNQPPTITIWPRWFPRLPWLSWRIHVEVFADANVGN